MGYYRLRGTLGCGLSKMGYERTRMDTVVPGMGSNRPKLFQVIPWRDRVPSNARLRAFLVSDNWDDFGFKTMFTLVVVDADGDNTIWAT